MCRNPKSPMSSKPPGDFRMLPLKSHESNVMSSSQCSKLCNVYQSYDLNINQSDEFWNVWHHTYRIELLLQTSVFEIFWKPLFMTLYDSLYLFISLYDSLWLFMTLYDSLYIFMTLYDSLWLFMTLYDSLWLLMTLCDSLWLFTTVHSHNIRATVTRHSNDDICQATLSEIIRLEVDIQPEGNPFFKRRTVVVF